MKKSGESARQIDEEREYHVERVRAGRTPGAWLEHRVQNKD